MGWQTFALISFHHVGQKSATKCPYKLQAAVKTHGSCLPFCSMQNTRVKISQQPENLIKVFFFLCFW